MSARDTALLAQARAWMRQDPDPETRDELAGLITRGGSGAPAALAALADRFGTRLSFGTAGLRGQLGAGPNRMNRVLVAQAAAGFAAYLLERAAERRRTASALARGGWGTPGTGSPHPRSREGAAAPASPVTVVIGYDGRRNSRKFATDSAEVFAGAGLRAILLPRPLPTPVLAFAVRHLGADAGVMVTASHNPPGDNGYKVYLGGDDQGSQIVAPADAEIAAHIQRVAAEGDALGIPRSAAYETAAEELIDAYVSATAAVAPAPLGAAGLRWVYTAMHGVGWETFSRVIETAGYPAPWSVSQQRDPDPTFRTVAFPNPEEPGAMDLAFAKARTLGAELVIANDPDADRLAVGVPDASVDGGWRRLTGNEVGLLLGWQAARTAVAEGPVAPGTSLACSLVSSPALRAVADRYGLDFHETLTGFKWISRAPGMIFGYEEALGYLVNPGTVRDKDGISAALALLGMAAEARGRDATLLDLLDEVAAEVGHFASGQVSLRVQDTSTIARIMTALRQDPPTAFGETAISSAEDLLTTAAGSGGGDVLRYRLADGSRVIVRPSGTEPKLKVYLDARAGSAAAAKDTVAALDDAVRALLSARG